LAEVPRDLICEECALCWGRSPNNVLVCASTCHKKPSNQSIIKAVENWIPGLSIARLGARLSVNSWMQSVNPVQKAKQSPSKEKILEQKTGQSERVVLRERIHALEAAASLQEETAAAEKAALRSQMAEQKTIAKQLRSHMAEQRTIVQQLRSQVEEQKTTVKQLESQLGEKEAAVLQQEVMLGPQETATAVADAGGAPLESLLEENRASCCFCTLNSPTGVGQLPVDHILRASSHQAERECGNQKVERGYDFKDGVWLSSRRLEKDGIAAELISAQSLLEKHSLAGTGQKFIQKSVRQLCIIQPKDEWELLGLEPEVL
jgi:uncharacterized coiled-coil protein SlyX